MAVIKIEICPYTQKEGTFQNEQHGRILNWQRKNMSVKHVLSHDKREILFHEEKYYKKLKILIIGPIPIKFDDSGSKQREKYDFGVNFS